MKIPFPHFLGKILKEPEKRQEYLLALLIQNEKIKAAVWREREGKVFLAGIGERASGQDWDEKIRAADEAIVEASGDLPQEAIQKVILGVSSSWIENEKIKHPYLTHLKKLCADLALKPLGFVTLIEALISYLKETEGTPPTVILVGVEKQEISATLVRAGRIEGTFTQPREEEESKILASLLGKFHNIEVFPSRMLIYDGGQDFEKIKQSLIDFPWTQKFPFLHFPKIESLPPEADIKAIAAASALQMGATFDFEEEKEEVKTEGEEATDELSEEPPREAAENFGFLNDQDVLDQKQPEVVDEKKKEKVPADELLREPVTSLPSKAVNYEPLSEEKKFTAPKIGFKIPSIAFPKLPFPPNLDLSFLSNFKPVILAVLVILLILGGVTYGLFSSIFKAKVILSAQTKTLEKEDDFLVVPNASSSQDKQISGKIIETEISGNKKAQTTGKKDVGDPAKGEVTVFNKTLKEKTFSTGTQIVANNLKFTLDGNVTVASATDTGTSLDYGTSKANVTAVDVGTAGNLPAGTNYTFKDFSDASYFAKNEKDFSGGSSREVEVVAKSDQDKLTSSLTDELTAQAKDNLSSRVGSEEKIIDKTLSSQVKQKKFDKDVGAEAKEVNLSLTISFKVMAFSQKDVKEKFLQVAESSKPENYDLDRESAKIDIADVQVKKDGSANLRVNFSGALIPRFNLEEITKQIKSKKTNDARNYLRGLDNVTDVEINFSPSFLGGLGWMPLKLQNIQVEVVSH